MSSSAGEKKQDGAKNGASRQRFRKLETPPPTRTRAKTKGYMVTVNEMVGNAVVVRDYEQENLDYLSRTSPHPTASQPVIDIEYDVKQQLDKIPQMRKKRPPEGGSAEHGARPPQCETKSEHHSAIHYFM